ncbi:MAG: hypothetical protein ABI417_08965, partial [Coleofasciculaceae cyanobacterium]
MTVITPGVGATIQAPSVEGQFMQIIEYFQGLETANGNVTSYFSGTYDSDTLLFAGAFNVPILPSGNTAAWVGNTVNFLSGTFSAGTGGTFTSTTALDYLLAVCMKIIALQNDITKNPANTQNVTIKIDANKNILSGTFSLPFTIAVTQTGA